MSDSDILTKINGKDNSMNKARLWILVMSGILMTITFFIACIESGYDKNNHMVVAWFWIILFAISSLVHIVITCTSQIAKRI